LGELLLRFNGSDMWRRGRGFWGTDFELAVVDPCVCAQISRIEPIMDDRVAGLMDER
jgi:hypothetical protein